MFVKILSGDLIPLETQSLEQTLQQLSDRLLVPHRHLKLLDPETGDEASQPKEMLYLLVSCTPTGTTLPTDVWWQWRFSDEVYELFEPIGSSFRPKHSPEEFQELVRDKSYTFEEVSHRSNMTVRRTLLGFMICRVSPVFLKDYLPRLQKHHYDEEQNCVYKLLCASRMNMLKIEYYSEEDTDEALYYIYKSVIPAFELPIGEKAFYKAIEMNLQRVFGYFAGREKVVPEIYIKLMMGLDHDNAKCRLQMIKQLADGGTQTEYTAYLTRYALKKLKRFC